MRDKRFFISLLEKKTNVDRWNSDDFVSDCSSRWSFVVKRIIGKTSIFYFAVDSTFDDAKRENFTLSRHERRLSRRQVRRLKSKLKLTMSNFLDIRKDLKRTINVIDSFVGIWSIRSFILLINSLRFHLLFGSMLHIEMAFRFSVNRWKSHQNSTLFVFRNFYHRV